MQRTCPRRFKTPPQAHKRVENEGARGEGRSDGMLVGGDLNERVPCLLWAHDTGEGQMKNVREQFCFSLLVQHGIAVI